VSDLVSLESTRRRLTPKQADTIHRLSAAAVAVLAREGFGGLTIRLVAAEAGMGAATAYTYFSSKEHLVAEVFWRRLASVPAPTNGPDSTAADRAAAVLRQVALLGADEPEFAGAVTAALRGNEPNVAHLRDRIGREIRDRLEQALGPDHNPEVAGALELLLTGALVYAGMGYASCTQVVEQLETAVGLLFRRR